VGQRRGKMAVSGWTYYPDVVDRLAVIVQLILKQGDVVVKQDLIQHGILPREEGEGELVRG
jgi:hypothetical protein